MLFSLTGSRWAERIQRKHPRHLGYEARPETATLRAFLRSFRLRAQAPSSRTDAGRWSVLFRPPRYDDPARSGNVPRKQPPNDRHNRSVVADYHGRISTTKFTPGKYPARFINVISRHRANSCVRAWTEIKFCFVPASMVITVCVCLSWKLARLLLDLVLIGKKRSNYVHYLQLKVSPIRGRADDVWRRNNFFSFLLQRNKNWISVSCFDYVAQIGNSGPD